MILCVIYFATTSAQRPFYAGSRPIGYPEVPENVFLQNLPHINIPLESRNDIAFARRVASYPINNQPFWFINARYYDDLRRNPRTYPQRKSFFNDSPTRVRLNNFDNYYY